MTLIAFMAVSTPAQEPRFFAKDVDFWGRRPKSQSVAPWQGEAAPPAGPARDLLERPTPENARRYLEWQQERLERLQKALEALESVTAEVASEKGMILFTRDECPYSRAQEEALRGLPVTILRPGQSPELWARHGVTATPTLVINGKTFVGLTDRATVERHWRGGRKP
jgi:glutaredoxin